MEVFVGIYEHRHGLDARVFKTRARAEGWRADIAIEWWRHEMPEHQDLPSDPQEAADFYFNRVSEIGEFFIIEACELEE
ncbi:MAG: hypothetical protein P4M05_28280 [Bradyrhizobium sp.]|nr:hypothetical protein [Bradyrhizobium sp.]